MEPFSNEELTAIHMIGVEAGIGTSFRESDDLILVAGRKLIRLTAVGSTDSLHEANIVAKKRDDVEEPILGSDSTLPNMFTSEDFLAHDRPLPVVKRGDLLSVFTAGAYGFSMSSNYNNRRRPAEVLVDGDKAQLIRRRETYEELVAEERV